MRFGPWEIALILIIVLIVFGVGRLPQVGGALGKAIHSFKKAQSGEEETETAKKAEAKPEEKKVDSKGGGVA